MNIQARRIKGDVFTSSDEVEVIFLGNYKELVNILYTVEVVSGGDVTHGGGASSGEYLHYKALERDADEDGDIDYGKCLIPVSQLEKGVSVIIVKGMYFTKVDVNAHKEAHDVWEQELNEMTDLAQIEEHKTLEPILTPELLETGQITLVWNELEDYV